MRLNSPYRKLDKSPKKELRMKSIDFKHKNELLDEELDVKMSENDSKYEKEYELECCSEQIIDFQNIFQKNSNLMNIFSDLRNLKHLEEFINKKKENNSQNDNDELNNLKKSNEMLKKQVIEVCNITS